MMLSAYTWCCLISFNLIALSNCCSNNEFACVAGTPACIMIDRRCDDDFDCFDRSDETNCENKCPTTCPEGQYQCNDCSCVPNDDSCTTQETPTELSTVTDEKTGNLLRNVILACAIPAVFVMVIVGVIYCKCCRKNTRIQPKPGQNENTTNQLTLQERDTLPDRRGNRRLSPIPNHLFRNKPVNTLYADDTKLSINEISVNKSLDRDHEL